MALGVESIPARVRAYLASRGQDSSNLRNNTILALVPDALRALVDQGHLRKTFAITCTSGVVSLAAALADAEPIILESKKQWVVTFDTATYPAQYKADRSSLILPATSEFIYWTLEDNSMLVANENGLGVFSDDGDIRNAPFVAALTSVTKGLEAVFIQTLAGMLSVSKAA